MPPPCRGACRARGRAPGCRAGDGHSEGAALRIGLVAVRHRAAPKYVDTTEVSTFAPMAQQAGRRLRHWPTSKVP
ncbi:hypothetical protein STRIP9103_00721 [Streptomyces ipomoeae 91-03]|uniref:Uncharacterized protein n=1 Tax=Streptomyces ipomoeae 91-03 TaxID=698759 RepID=L1L4R7_9ACTN|nr:hypothetical protein STRIP9103_00721 [Streptomyces ipomoeae 91-03]